MDYNLFNKRDSFYTTYNENDIQAIETIIEEDDYSNEANYDIVTTYQKLTEHIKRFNTNKKNMSIDDELITIEENIDDDYNKEKFYHTPLKLLEDQPDDIDWISSIIDD